MATPLPSKSTEENKTWRYEHQGVSLSFTLRSDIKKELKAAIEILQRAIGDFQEQLDSMPKGTK